MTASTVTITDDAMRKGFYETLTMKIVDWEERSKDENLTGPTQAALNRKVEAARAYLAILGIKGSVVTLTKADAAELQDLMTYEWKISE
jgi:hypothetical protein